MRNSILCAYRQFGLRIVGSSSGSVSPTNYTIHYFVSKNINEIVNRLENRSRGGNHSFSLEQDFVIERYITNWWMYECKEYSNES